MWLGKTGETNSWYHIYPFAQLLEQRDMDPLILVRHKLPPFRLSKVVHFGFQSKGTAKDLITIFKKGARAIRQYQPEVLITFNPIPWGAIAWLLAKMFRKKIIMGLIGGETDPNRSGVIKRWLINFMCRNSSAVFVTGSVFKEQVVSLGIEEKKVHVFPHCVQDEWLETPPATEFKYDLVTVCALLPGKRVDDAIRALARLHKKGLKLSFCVVGDGPEMNYLKELAQDLQIGEFVHFIGMSNEVKSYLLRSKIFVQTSESEGLSLALVEAVALGLVPVATEAGAERDLINHDNNGYLVKPYDIDGMVDCISELQEEEVYKRVRTNLISSRSELRMEKAILASAKVIDSI